MPHLLSPLPAAGVLATLPAAAAEAKVAWLCKPVYSRDPYRAGGSLVEQVRRLAAVYLRRAR